MTSAIAVQGVVIFSTHLPTLPAANTCDSLGEARAYNIGFMDGMPVGANRYVAVTGGGLNTSPVGGTVNLTLQSGVTIKRNVIFGSGSDRLKPKEAPKLATPASFKKRAYWFLEQ